MTTNHEDLASKRLYPAIPEYLNDNYWWAYLHPRGVQLFERQWLVNLILFGNYRKLCNRVAGLFKENAATQSLQIACVYGDLTQRLAATKQGKGHLDVVDVAPIQLDNLQKKLGPDDPVACYQRDSANLGLSDDSYQQTLLFFLLHEQPWQQRLATLKEAVRVTRPGGQLIIIDYHKPSLWFPLRYLLSPLLGWLEPYARDLWRHQIHEWLPTSITPQNIVKKTFFGGLYQLLVITLPDN